MSYRVVQWATGNQGVEAIRAVLDRPDMELVGAKVYGADKEGVDAAVIAGRPPCGVSATRDIDQLLALGADCVAYFPRHASLDEVCRILASGANVTTTAFLFHPRSVTGSMPCWAFTSTMADSTGNRAARASWVNI